MLTVTCSRCGSKRALESLEALAGARFCDVCGQQAVLVQANVQDMLAFLPTARSNIAIQEQTRKEEMEKQEKLQAHIEAEIVRQRELESKCVDLTKRELEINQRISDEEKKLKSEEENLQRLNNQTFVARQVNQSLENDHQKIQSDIEEKTVRLRELKARIEDVTKREMELIENTTSQETKLKLAGDQFEQINKNIQELNRERQSLETRNLVLTEAAEEKTAHLRELETNAKVLQVHTQDLKQHDDQETKLVIKRESELKSVEGQIEQFNNRALELENTVASLITRRQELEEANSMLVNQELDKLLQDKRKDVPNSESGSIQNSVVEEEVPEFNSTPDAVARREAQSLEWLGIVAKHRKQYERSEAHFRNALEIRERLGDDQDVAFTLGLLLELAKERKEYSKARDYALKAKEIHTRIGDKQSENRLLDELNSIRDLEGST
ncbi:MAG: tetratricopeptide repeat protein [Candidatus Bathyarchaeia archaeon]